MGDLQSPRVKPARSFENTGLDFAGPFTIKEGNQRKPSKHKAYICVYVCLCTKAVFLDLVADLTTDAFFASLRRFVALYGVPSHVHSENGSNFLGADTELKILQSSLLDSSAQEAVQHFAFCKGIKWHFIQSRSPHFGGLWEAAVHSMKTLLKKVVGEHVLRTDEFNTVLLEAAAVMNSRPLTPVDSQATDLTEPLTPGHFLHRNAPTSLPSDTDASPTSTYGKWWRLTQYLSNELWRRWRKEYLIHLQGRGKWKLSQKNTSVGDIILQKDDDLFTKSWPLGRVTAMFPESDGKVRAKLGKKSTDDLSAKLNSFITPCNFHVLLNLICCKQCSLSYSPTQLRKLSNSAMWLSCLVLFVSKVTVRLWF